MMLVSCGRQELRVSRGDLLLDLQEHGVLRTVPFEQHEVIPQPHASCADHLETDIDFAEQIEEVTAHRRERFAVFVERTQDLLCGSSADSPEEWPSVAEMRASVTVPIGELRQQVQRPRS